MIGTRVVDFSRVFAGPWATQHLADQGAEVVKVEPIGGDETRRFPPMRGPESTYFAACNRNKRSIELDLRTEAGRRVAQALARASDVLVHNWRPGIDADIGLDAATLSAEHPRLVHVSIAAFGAAGDPAWTRRAGYDLILQAMGGAMAIGGHPGQPPARAGTPIADILTGMAVVQAVLHGLLQRERTGRGQAIVVNMMQAQAAALGYYLSGYTLAGVEEEPRGNAHRSLVPYDVYPCADGSIALACGNDPMWQRLRHALGIEDRAAWRTNAGRLAARAEVDETVKSALAGRTRADADRELTEAGVPCGPVLGVADVAEHPAVSLVALELPGAGPMEVAGPILQTADTRARHRAPPALGAHRDEILRELGFDRAGADQLAAEGAFGPVR